MTFHVEMSGKSWDLRVDPAMDQPPNESKPA